ATGEAAAINLRLLQFDVFNESWSLERNSALINATAVHVHEEDVVAVAEPPQSVLTARSCPGDSDGSRAPLTDQVRGDHGAPSGAPRNVTRPERSAAVASMAVNSRPLMNAKTFEFCIAYLQFWSNLLCYGGPGLQI